jgi:hypothetical protein
MNRHVNAIAGRLNLRPPQRESLGILDRVTEIVPPKKNIDLSTALAAIKSEFPTITDFEREFPSLCFALATGVGKTASWGAFISYLHLTHGINHFWCNRATTHALRYGGTLWKYLLIPHDVIAENLMPVGLASQFAQKQ